MKKYTEMLTIPLAFVMLLAFNWLANIKGWPIYGVEVFQKLFIGLVLFLVILGLGRIVFMIMFPYLYKYIDDDFNENMLWNVLSTKEKTWAGLFLFALFCLLLTWLTAAV